MTFDWYKIFNLTEFLALDLVSKDYELILSDLGVKTISVYKGNETSLQYDGVTLPIQFNGDNPFSFDGYAVYLNTTTQDVYLGIEVDES